MKQWPSYYYFLPYIILYFFFNNAGLPQGLLFTTLLTPVFLYFLYREKDLKNCLKWGLLLLIPIPFQVFGNIDAQAYIQSTVLIITAWVFLFTAVKAVNILKGDLESIFFRVLMINTILVFIALIMLPIPGIRDLMWNSIPISPDIAPFPRLNLFAYEPSHYALLMSPIFIFYGIKLVNGQLKHTLLYTAALLLPLILSLSFGVIIALIIAFIISLGIWFRKIPLSSQKVMLYLSLIGIAIVVGISLLWPDNPVWMRIQNIFAGSDTSAKGRLMDSFMFASDLSALHNFWFGVGPGQVKILAHDLIINHYQYSSEFAEVVRIPNSMGEMLATYGLYGFLLKIFFEIYFFVKLKVYNNVFSLCLFLFIFIYQFTGSFVMNIAELGIWALVFSSAITGFGLKQFKQQEI